MLEESQKCGSFFLVGQQGKSAVVARWGCLLSKTEREASPIARRLATYTMDGSGRCYG